MTDPRAGAAVGQAGLWRRTRTRPRACTECAASLASQGLSTEPLRTVRAFSRRTAWAVAGRARGRRSRRRGSVRNLLLMALRPFIIVIFSNQNSV